MARKTVTITISKDNRDKDKTFLITEMPAYQAERWATRALLAITNSGAEVPEDFTNAGMAGMATFGLQMLTSIDFDVAAPLLDEMMGCVQINMGNGVIRALMEDGDGADIEEISTRLTLRQAVLELHMGFSFAAMRRTMALRVAAAMQDFSNTSTSPQSSEPSLPVG